MSKRNIETSREIRQWVKLGIAGLSSFAMFDMYANNGEIGKKIVESVKKGSNKVKRKIDEVKEKRIYSKTTE